MPRVLLNELIRAVCNWRFAVAVGATVIVALISGSDNITILKQSSMVENIGELSIRAAAACMQMDAFLLTLPILCVIPYADSFVEDLQTHFLREYLPLAGKNRYLFSKVTVTALSGGLALCVGQLIVLLICTGIFPPLGIEPGEYAFTYYHYFLALLMVVFGGLAWSLVGGISGAALRNRYMAYAMPFIIFYVLSSFQIRYFRTAYVFSLQEWIRPAHLALPTALICGAAAVAGVYFIYYFIMRRRLYEV